MMAGKNQAALAVYTQTEVIFPFKLVVTLTFREGSSGMYFRGGRLLLESSKYIKNL